MPFVAVIVVFVVVSSNLMREFSCIYLTLFVVQFAHRNLVDFIYLSPSSLVVVVAVVFSLLFLRLYCENLLLFNAN